MARGNGASKESVDGAPGMASAPAPGGDPLLPGWADLPWIAVLAATYTALVVVILASLSSNRVISIVWPPSGLALGALLLGGRRLWPGVLLGALAGNLLAKAGAGPFFYLFGPLGNTLEALACATLLGRIPSFRPAFAHPRDFLWLGVAGALSACLAALVGVGALGLTGFLPPGTLAANLLTWWQGDLLGILIVAPLFLVWRSHHATRIPLPLLVEFLLFLGVIVLSGQIIFMDWFHDRFGPIAHPYWAFLFVVWGGVRFGRIGAGAVLTSTLVQSLFSVAKGRGGFAKDPAWSDPQNLWFYMIVLSVVGMVLAQVLEAQREAENARRAANAYNRSLIEASLDPLVTIGSDGRIADVNAATESVTGRSRLQLIGSDFSTYFTRPEDARAGYQTVFREGFVRDFPLELRHLDGHLTSVLYNASLYRDDQGRIAGVFAAARDITERKLAEEARRTANAYNRSLIEASLDPLVTIGADGKITDVNQATEAATGFTREELIGSDFSNYFTHPDEARAGYRTVFREGFVRDYPLELRHLDGHLTSVLYNASVFRDDQGRIVGVFAAARDITERKKAEQALRESEEKFRALINEIQVAVVIHGADTRIQFCNPVARRLLGLDEEHIQGRLSWDPAWHFCREDGSPMPVEDYPVNRVLATAKPLQGLMAGIHHPQEERTDWVLVDANPILDPGGRIDQVIVSFTDLSERKRIEAERQLLEAEMRQAQKLDSLGSLAGGVAHDMNNVLAAIQAVAQTLQIKRPEGTALATSMDTILQATARGRDLVQRLTNFTRKEIREPVVLNLNDLVREEMEILRRTTLQKVDLVAELEEPLPPIRGERGSLGSALMNLCVNAVDAMPEGGTLTLRTRRQAQGQVELAVQDTGVGMSPEVLARAMEPFFTTKPFGKGTGLGLATAYSTAKAHGGSMTIQSSPGKGTEVLLRFPAIADEPRPAERQEPASAPGPASIRILLVDDDELIRASVPIILQELGHTVTVAAGGREALEILDQGLQVDLVVLDLNMPGMGGVETLGNIRERQARLPVLLATGYLDPQTEEILRQDGRCLSVAKPFTVEQLNRKFAEIAALG